MSRTDAARLASPQPELRDRLAEHLLRWPLAAVLAALAAAQIACWLPHYLTWPFWADHDVFATLAQGWDGGQLPYRDLLCNNFPGTIYLFWVLGRLTGWGRTLPFYALDAAFVLMLGAAMVAWSRRQFGRLLPGLAGYLAFLSYYLSQDYARAGQHDWHAALFAVLGIFALECGASRGARWLSAGALALAVVTRPQAVLFLPAVALALDERVRQPGEPLRRSVRPCVEWALAFGVFVLLGFAPLLLAGVLPDFIRGVRLASYGSRYNQVTPRSVAACWITQLSPLRVTVVPLALLALRQWGTTASRRTALTWIVALGSVSLYKPLSPWPHGYLDFPLLVVWTVALAALAHLVVAAAAVTPSVRLVLVLMVLGLGTTARPVFCSVPPAVHALAALRHGQLPPDAPLGYRSGSAATAGHYAWDDYRAVLAYLRHETRPETRVANVLRGDPALTAPAGRRSALPAESVTWLQMVNRADEPRFADALAAARDAVVVWVPAESDAPRGLPLPRITRVIRQHFEPEAKFGVIEVWRRKGPGAGMARR